MFPLKSLLQYKTVLVSCIILIPWARVFITLFGVIVYTHLLMFLLLYRYMSGSSMSQNILRSEFLSNHFLILVLSIAQHFTGHSIKHLFNKWMNNENGFKQQILYNFTRHIVLTTPHLLKWADNQRKSCSFLPWI